MVYNGRPSGGCARCKERRKKCDETKPACWNCTRLGQPCPGFPNQLDLMFKHETASVTEKAQSRRNAAERKRGRRRVFSSQSSAPIQPTSSDLPPISGISQHELQQSIDDFASDWPPPEPDHDLGDSLLQPQPQQPQQPPPQRQGPPEFLFTDFLLWPYDEPAAQQFWGTLMGACDATDPRRSPRHLLTEAIALGSVGRFPYSYNLVVHAEALYERACEAVERVAVCDETVQAMRLLRLYECVAGGPRRRPDERSSGGGEQEDGISLRAVLAQAQHLLVQDPRPGTGDAVDALLHDAYELQTALEQWDRDMPPGLAYRTTAAGRVGGNPLDKTKETSTSMDPSISWPTSTHIYANRHAASLRNYSRVSQLLCSNVVIHAIRWLDPAGHAGDGRFRAAVFREQYLVDDIAASVPFLLGSHDERGARDPSAAEGGCFSPIGGCFLLWPLYVASRMTTIPAWQSQWLTHRLDAICKQYGLVLADPHAPAE